MSADDEEHTKELDALALKEAKELEAARKERMELLASEQKKIMNQVPSEKDSHEDKIQYLISQSEVFAHFLAGMYTM